MRLIFLVACALVLSMAAGAAMHSPRIVPREELLPNNKHWVTPHFTQSKDQFSIGGALGGAGIGGLIGGLPGALVGGAIGGLLGKKPAAPGAPAAPAAPSATPATIMAPVMNPGTLTPPSPSIAQRITGASNKVTSGDEQCVVCQYMIQRVQAAMAEAMAIGDAQPTLLQEKSSIKHSAPVKTSFLEVSTEVTEKWGDSERFTQAPGDAGDVAIPKRYRMADTVKWRPEMARYDSSALPFPNPLAEQERFAMETVQMELYNRFQGLCASRAPQRYTPVCHPLLMNFRIVFEALRYGDRPDQVCMRLDLCPADAYIRTLTPHAVNSA